jgi:small conductance mechanosensitive channel
VTWEGIKGFFENERVVALTGTGLKIALTLVIAFVLTRLLRKAVQKVDAKVAEQTTPMRNLQRTRTLANILSSTGMVVIWVLATLTILGLLHFNLAPILAGVGILGLAIGFGAQDLVKDVVSGFFIILEDQYGVGDTIEINGVANGVVETLTLRVTGLRALDGTVHFVSNGDISHLANRSKDWARAVIDVGVAYKEESSKVRAVLEEVADETTNDTEDLGNKVYARPKVLGVETLGEYEVVWRVIVDTKPGKQWEVGRELRERIKVAFDRHDVEIPYPHRVMITADAAPD